MTDFASWSSSTHGFPLDGELATDNGCAQGSRQSRKSQRVPVEFPAGLRQRGASGVSVQIMDLSTDGFRVSTHLELLPGTDVWLRLPGLEPCHARVKWSDGPYIGCAFERPLHSAVLQMMIQKARTA